MDVKILDSSWKLFRKSCLKLTDGLLDPLIGRYFTLAAFSDAIYKTMFMVHDIGIIPWGGKDGGDLYKINSHKWML